MRQRPYWACLSVGVVFGVTSFFVDMPRSHTWPGTAAQVLATVLVAVAIEGRNLPVARDAAEAFCCAVLALVVAVSLGVSIVAASMGKALQPFYNAVVLGALLSFGLLLLLSFTMRLTVARE